MKSINETLEIPAEGKIFGKAVVVRKNTKRPSAYFNYRTEKKNISDQTTGSSHGTLNTFSDFQLLFADHSQNISCTNRLISSRQHLDADLDIQQK